MGFMSGSSSTIIFSLLPILYPGEVSQKQAYFEIAFSFSMIIGGFTGNIMYKYSGYEFPFLLIAASYIFLGIPIVYSLKIEDQYPSNIVKS